jgi:hypothetical protein
MLCRIWNPGPSVSPYVCCRIGGKHVWIGAVAVLHRFCTMIRFQLWVALSHFIRTTKFCLGGGLQMVKTGPRGLYSDGENATVEDCKRECEIETSFNCVSFDYIGESAYCDLSTFSRQGFDWMWCSFWWWKLLQHEMAGALRRNIVFLWGCEFTHLLT